MLIDGGLELLTEAEAWARVLESDIGRVGLSVGAMPAIFPVNYAVIDGAIVFRTAPGSKMSAASRSNVVAFEVDDYDRNERTGWSVLVVGPAEVVHDVGMTFKVIDHGLEPWAGPTERTAVVRIWPEFVSGRRIVPSRHRGIEDRVTVGQSPAGSHR